MAWLYFLTIIFLYHLPNIFIYTQGKRGASRLPSVTTKVGNLPFQWNLWLPPNMITAKSRSAETSGGLWSDPLLKIGSALSSDLATWDFIQAGLVNVQGCRRYNLSGQPAPEHAEKLFLQHSLNLSSFHHCGHSPATVSCLAPSSPCPSSPHQPRSLC